jgi:tetratricopeptide (TPR) repeat protein
MSENERNEDVIKRFEEMLKTNKNYFFDVEDFLDIIDEYISTANYVLASKAIKMGLAQYQNNIDILLYKAELYSLSDNLPKAEEVIAFIKSIDSNRVEIPLLEAELYSRKFMHGKAVKALKKALKLAEDKAEVYELLTVEYLYLEDYSEALNASLKCLNYDPESATALYNAVTCYDLLDEIEKAIGFLENYVEKYPFAEIAWSLLAKKYIEKQQYKKAIQALDFAIAIDDKFLGAYYDKAFAYTKLGDYVRALEFYKLTLKITDPTAFTYYHIAKLYVRLNDYNNAVSYYLSAINEDPGHYKSWMKLIELKLKNNDLEHAFELATKAIEVINNQELFELLAEIQVKRNKIDQAIEALENSIKLAPLRLTTIIKLADLYKQNNQIEKYRNILLNAKTQFPESKEIKNRMFGHSDS